MKRIVLTTVLILLTNALLPAQDSPRKTTSLSGEWTFHRDGSKETKTVALPTHWETHEGLKFDGIGWYEKTMELSELPKGRRLLLHFDGVATHATVYWNDKKLGEHLGAWTPFRFDVTEEVKKGRKHTIKVRVDEKVGHNTQGFLPIIAPHFGGIWQGVRLIEVGDNYFHDLDVSVSFEASKQQLQIRTPASLALYHIIRLEFRLSGTDQWHRTELQWKDNATIYGAPRHPRDGGDIIEQFFKLDEFNSNPKERTASAKRSEEGLSIVCKSPKCLEWSPESKSSYDIQLSLVDRDGKIVDCVQTKLAHRTITTRGDQFLLNGQPLSIRGVLNWGYYPPSLAPTPTDEQWRSDLKLIKSWGFNLMKCCLWVPPKRLLEIADEEGVLIWLEYPTWHPKLTPQYQAELMQEYKEFHELDRNHPSVILRSLTCETGPGADIKVIQALYDQCKKMSGGLVVDDSSWIEWNRVFDFYDDHPYGNNHTWVATLDRLKKYIATSKYGVKPLCLGEAIAADTWVPTRPMLEAIAKAKADPKQAWSLDERGYPFWVPGFFDANQKWLERMARVCGGAVDEEKLYRDSLRYAMKMRKYQMETMERVLPPAGYVVSVLRDFPLASMGLIDYRNQGKWDTAWDWLQSNSLSIEIDEQSKLRGQPLKGRVYLNSTRAIQGTLILETRCSTGNPLDQQKIEVNCKAGVRSKIADFQFTHPLEGDLYADLKVGNRIELTAIERVQSFLVDSSKDQPARIIRRLDNTLLTEIENGASYILLPEGKPGNFPMRSHWFLRGGPFLNPHHRLFDQLDASKIQQLQHFDLASDVISDINYLEEIDPILMLWDNHDIKEVKTHGLVFETRIGKGRLLVSALKHDGEINAAGKWLLQTFLKHLDSGPPPRNALKPETIARIRAKLNEKKLELVTKSWQFMPDGNNEGLKLGWEKPGFDDKAWKPIKIGAHWEGQGYPALDGWAWYRLSVEVPKDWTGVQMYLNSEGVDDAYEIYINGTKVGSGGDIPNKKTAFEDRTAHAIPAGLLKPGEKNVIAVRVYDWYGAGGIHRPMSLSNVPLVGVDILR